jgi:sec-independent protein translocase protein TatB
MFGIDSGELLIIAVVALVVIGPKDLPRVMRTVGGFVGKARGMAKHFRSGLDTMMREGRMSATVPQEPKTTRLMVTSQVDGARGAIDGATGALPLVKEVTAGDHTVTVEADGYLPVTLKAVAVDGALVPVEVDLTPKPVLLDVRAASGARITIDGRPAGTAPVTALEIPAGRHFITVEHRGRREFHRLAQALGHHGDVDITEQFVSVGTQAPAVERGQDARLAAEPGVMQRGIRLMSIDVQRPAPGEVQ